MATVGKVAIHVVCYGQQMCYTYRNTAWFVASFRTVAATVSHDKFIYICCHKTMRLELEIQFKSCMCRRFHWNRAAHWLWEEHSIQINHELCERHRVSVYVFCVCKVLPDAVARFQIPIRRANTTNCSNFNFRKLLVITVIIQSRVWCNNDDTVRFFHIVHIGDLQPKFYVRKWS